MRQYQDQVAVVTGATSGIGRAVALRLAQEGMNVFVTGRRQEKLKDLEQCKDAQGGIFPFHCDMTKEEQVVEFFKKVKERFNKLHVLVNNAGTALYTKVSDCQLDRWRNMFELNVCGTGVATREALKLMNESSIDDGYIINISSIAAHAVPDMVGKHVYNASKHALRVITEGLRAELTEKGSNIRVSMISPGSVATEIGEVGGWLSVFQSEVPVPTLAPEDIADTVIYLLNLPPKVQRDITPPVMFSFKGRLNEQISDMIVRPAGETILG